jgi:hypothetical protein
MLGAIGHTNSSSKPCPKDSFLKVITTSKLLTTTCTKMCRSLPNLYPRLLKFRWTKSTTLTDSMNLSTTRRHLTKVPTFKMIKRLIHRPYRIRTLCSIIQEWVSRNSGPKLLAILKPTKARFPQTKSLIVDNPLFRPSLSRINPKRFNKDNSNNQR